MKCPKLFTYLAAFTSVCLIFSACGSYSQGHGVIQGGFETSSDSTPVSSAPAPSSVSQPEPVVVIEELLYELPEGFSLAEGEQDIWYAPDYPYDPSSVAFDMTDTDYDFDSRTEADFEEYLQDELSATYENDPQLEISRFNHTIIGGWPAIRLEYSYQTDELSVFTIVVLINADNRYSFTFTDTTEDRVWFDSFEDTISSIVLVEEVGAPSMDSASTIEDSSVSSDE